MKVFRHILIASAAFMAAAACTKTVYDGQQDQPMPIRISAADGLTKALLDNGTFGTTGNRIQVYDIYTSSDNVVSTYIDAYAGPDVSSASSQHVQGKTWPFEDKSTLLPVSYDWTPDGVHRFFGWLAKDAGFGATPMTPEAFFGAGFQVNGNVLSIPETALTPTSAQFDFLYSDMHVRNLNNDPDFMSAVPQNFSHLFTAFSIGALNTSHQPVNLKSFTLDPVRNTNSATITWAADETAGGQYPATVTYGEGSVGTEPLMTLADTYTIVTDQKVGNIFTGGSQMFHLIWPQSSEDVHSTGAITVNPDTEESIYPSDYKMSVTYTVTTDEGESEEITKRLNFPDLAWEAGKKYHFDVVFSDKMVELKAVVNPWNYEYSDVDFSDAMVSVKENHYLVWDGTTADLNTTDRYAIIRNGQPVKGTFTIDTPQGGTWLVSLTGDIDAFEVSPASGIIDGTSATIIVKPLVGDPQRDYTVNVKFAVRRPDGRVIAADDVVQPAGTKYTIVLPSNK